MFSAQTEEKKTPKFVLADCKEQISIGSDCIWIEYRTSKSNVIAKANQNKGKYGKE